MAQYPDVAVVGGGIVGLTAAYFLAKAGLSVEVLDRSDLGREASWAGAGILPPGNPDRAATPADKLRAIGSARLDVAFTGLGRDADGRAVVTLADDRGDGPGSATVARLCSGPGGMKL